MLNQIHIAWGQGGMKKDLITSVIKKSIRLIKPLRLIRKAIKYIKPLNYNLITYPNDLETIKNSKSLNIEIEVIAVAYKRLDELKIFVQSWLNQTESNWTLTVIHDGFNENFIKIMEGFSEESPKKIRYKCTKIRHNDYGHSLREIGLKGASGDFVLITNADNYYIPKALKFINDAIEWASSLNKFPDVLIFDMVHSHSNPGNRKSLSYSYFKVQYERNRIDIGAAIVSTSLARMAGFQDKSYSADASYFEEVGKKIVGGEAKNCKNSPNSFCP